MPPPPPNVNDYIKEEAMREAILREQQNRPNTEQSKEDKLYEELQTPIFVMILFIVFGVIIYRKLSEAVNSVRSTLKSTEETAKVVTNSFLKPFVGGSVISFVASKIFKNFFSRAQDKKE